MCEQRWTMDACILDIIQVTHLLHFSACARSISWHADGFQSLQLDQKVGAYRPSLAPFPRSSREDWEVLLQRHWDQDLAWHSRPYASRTFVTFVLSVSPPEPCSEPFEYCPSPHQSSSGGRRDFAPASYPSETASPFSCALSPPCACLHPPSSYRPCLDWDIHPGTHCVDRCADQGDYVQGG